MLDQMAQEEYGNAFDQLDEEYQALLKAPSVGLKTGWSLKEEVDISQERYPSARKK